MCRCATTSARGISRCARTRSGSWQTRDIEPRVQRFRGRSMLVSEALLSGVNFRESDCPTVQVSTTQAQSLTASAAVAHAIGER